MRSIYIVILCMSMSGIAHSGAVGGSKSGTSTIGAQERDVYTITYERNKSAIFQLTGDGSTDLDCFVYDSDKNLIEIDVDPGDVCLIAWLPKQTRKYTIAVLNKGNLENSYRFQTN
jgi:hypothetical protein